MELEAYLESTDEPILNLGCGKTKDKKHFGIDILNFDCVDLVADLNEGIPLPAKTFKHIIGIDFLEHIDPKKNIQIMEEIYRVLDFEGQFHFMVPSTDGNNMGAFQDPTHYSFWNEKKFWYFMDDEFGQGFRTLYDINCRFIPLQLQTFWNEYNVTYVKGVFKKRDSGVVKI